MADEPDSAFGFGEREEILWRGSVVARLRPGPGLLSPRVELDADPMLDSRTAGAAKQRLEAWLAAWLGERLAPLRALSEAAAGADLSAAGRGLSYRLQEALGCLEREEVESLLPALTAADRQILARLGVRFGLHHLYLPPLLKPAAVEARLRLWRLATGNPAPLPPVGRTVLRDGDVPAPEVARIAGFALVGDFALRVDVLERIAAAVRAQARSASPFAVPPQLASEAGLSRAELERLVEALGFRPLTLEGGETVFARPRHRRDPSRRAPVPERKRRAVAGPTTSPFAVLARLKAAP
jgi:ATP-dependent RNA helicase SUPV3L1/SUV3